MRNPERIPEVLDEIEETWKEHPDLRLGQLIWFIADGNDPFYIEDDELMRKMGSKLETKYFIDDE